jgi:trk system potassium uptake protein TrkH
MTGSLRSHIAPGRVIIISILVTIVIGTALLALPIARTMPIPLMDLFFTATSATCVTGFTTISLSDFTTFGQCIILALIQIGGLGLITTTFFFMYLFLNVGLAGNVMASELLDIDSWIHVRHTLLLIALITIISELAGALIIFSIIHVDLPLTTAAFFSLFHAVSSFCNAGIIVSEDIIMRYAHSIPLISTTVALMFSGALGFITWYELIRWVQAIKKRKRYRFSLQTAIILRWVPCMILVTALFYFLLERTHTLASTPLPFGILTSFFHAVSFKGTGFMLENISALHPATLFMLMIVAFIGSSPGSTGSGIKITTLVVFMAAIKATVLGRSAVEISNRRIPNDQVYKAIAIVAVSIAWILFSTFLLLITEPTWRFDDIFFEAFSAFTTLGITTGSTASLTALGKIIIIASMIVGRIGSLTLLLSLKLHKQNDESTLFSYPEERVMLG